MNSKNIYKDVIDKSMPEFDKTFASEISATKEKHPVYDTLDTTPE